MTGIGKAIIVPARAGTGASARSNFWSCGAMEPCLRENDDEQTSAVRQERVSA